MVKVNYMAAVVALILAASLSVKWGAAQVHHVVGGDRGWDVANDVFSWSSTRTFSLGDDLWFLYSAAEEIVAELRSKEEYESCDVSNPLRMYTDGLNSISLDKEGSRYFASTKPERCKAGLKLHVEVMPQGTPENNSNKTASESSVSAKAAAPTTPPSGSPRLPAVSEFFFVGLWLCYVAS